MARRPDQSDSKDDRPGLTAAMARVRSGETGGIVVATLDRFSRQSTIDGLKRVAEIHHAGGQVASVGGEVPVDPTGVQYGSKRDGNVRARRPPHVGTMCGYGFARMIAEDALPENIEVTLDATVGVVGHYRDHKGELRGRLALIRART